MVLVGAGTSGFLGNTSLVTNAPTGGQVVTPQGVTGALFHSNAVFNPYRYTFDPTPYAALDWATFRPEVGGHYGSEATWRVQPGGDLLSYTALISCFDAICAKVDATGATTFGRGSYPVVSNINNPLIEADNAAYEAAGGQQEWLAANYGACPEVEVTVGSACQAGASPYVGYTVNVGVYLYSQVDLRMGQQVIDTKTAQYIVAEDELAGSTDINYTEMWGGAANLVDAVMASSITRFTYVVLPFTFSKSLGSSISMVSSMFSRTEIQATLARRESLIFRSAANVDVQNARTNAALADADLTVALDCRYVLLEDLYRDAFASSAFEQVILRTQPQIVPKAVGQRGTDVHLRAEGYVVAFILMVQREAAIKLNLLNYYAGINGLDAITTLSLDVNSTNYFRVEAQRARTLFPAQAALRTPRIPVYLLYFSPIVFSLQVISGKNFSLVADAYISMTWQEGLDAEICRIYVFHLQLTFVKYRQQHASLLLR